LQTIIEKKLQPLVQKKLTEYLGEMDDDDLLKFVLDHIRERKSASELVEGLEPVSTSRPFNPPFSHPSTILFHLSSSSPLRGFET